MIATIIISILLVGVITWIIAGLVRNKEKGKSSCGCSCASCPMARSCHADVSKCHSASTAKKA